MNASIQPEFAAPPHRRQGLLELFARRCLAMLLVVVALSGGVAHAGEDAAARAAVAGDSPVAAGASNAHPARHRRPAGTLVVFNRPVIALRAVVLGVPPQERAATALTLAEIDAAIDGFTVTAGDAAAGADESADDPSGD